MRTRANTALAAPLGVALLLAALWAPCFGQGRESAAAGSRLGYVGSADDLNGAMKVGDRLWREANRTQGTANIIRPKVEHDASPDVDVYYQLSREKRTSPFGALGLNLMANVLRAPLLKAGPARITPRLAGRKGWRVTIAFKF